MNLTRHSLAALFYPGPVNIPCVFETSPSDVLFKIADNGHEVLQAFHLLYQEYKNAKYVQENKNKILFIKHHFLPETTFLIAKNEDCVVGTVSFIRDSSNFGLPIDELYSKELSILRIQGRKIVEVSSLASNHLELSRKASHLFMKFIVFYSIFTDIDDVCIMVNPRHASMYQKRCGFKIFGDEKIYPRVNAPAVAMHLDMHELRRSITSTYGNEFCQDRLVSMYRSASIELHQNFLSLFEASSPVKPRNPLDGSLVHSLLHEIRHEVETWPAHWKELVEQRAAVSCGQVSAAERPVN